MKKHLNFHLNFGRIYKWSTKNGYHFKVEVVVSATLNKSTGMSVDLPGLDALVKKILEQESYRDSIRQINMVVKTIELQLAKKEIKLISVNFLEARGFGLKYKNGKFNIIRSDYAKNKSGELSYIRSDLNNLGKIDSMRINHFATEFEELIQI